ncbi:MAG TPA: LLM class flavin-dependent oxidoreductase [Pseudonocardiaceae bacterium]|nr:LLM class flavin-dependent oxidoreductase [Pseudonocardiaceae bacterium]
MKYGVVLPGGAPAEQVELGRLAERAGWDGVFVPELAYGVDAWTLLAAIAAGTSRVLLGTNLTPLPWRRPWKVASQVATLDAISGGRAVLGVGVGAVDPELPDGDEATDLRTRAEMMDEGIDLIRSLWAGAGDYEGRYYRFRSRGSGSRSVPIWVVGLWPRPKSMRRVLRCDGILTQFGGERSPDDVRAVREWLAERDGRQDIIVDGETRAGESVAAYAEAGATWWLETRWLNPGEIAERIAAGPPGL